MAPAANTAAPASALRRARRDRRYDGGRGAGSGAGGAGEASGTTPIRTEARTPSQVAVITTEPGRSAATHPSLVASATSTSLVDQTTGRCGSGLFAWSIGVALRTKVRPAT